jgi:hypothetical protein
VAVNRKVVVGIRLSESRTEMFADLTIRQMVTSHRKRGSGGRTTTPLVVASRPQAAPRMPNPLLDHLLPLDITPDTQVRVPTLLNMVASITTLDTNSPSMAIPRPLAWPRGTRRIPQRYLPHMPRRPEECPLAMARQHRETQDTRSPTHMARTQ